MNRKEAQKGFTLVEMVIGITIVALIVGAAAAGLKVFYQQEKLDKTTDHRTQIEVAIGEYANKYGALPCPAPLIGTNIEDPNFGRQVSCRNSAAPVQTRRVPGREDMNVHIGAIPARDLGLPLDVMTDSWGNLFTYAVTESMTAAGAYALPEPDMIISNTGPLLAVGPQFIQNWSPEGNSAIQKDNHLYLISNTDDDDDQEVLLIVDYFEVEPPPEIPPDAVGPNGEPLPQPVAMPFPSIAVPGTNACDPNLCISATDIVSNLINYTDLLYDLAAIEVQGKLPDGTIQSLSPENPETGAQEPGHLSFAIISHGPSGLGAYSLGGNIAQSCAATGATFEAQNCDYDSATALALDPVSGIANAAVFTMEAGFSIAGDPRTDANYHDDIVSNSETVESWPPRRLCDPTDDNPITALVGLQLKNPDGSWGECRNIGGEQGVKGQQGPRGPTGPPGHPGNVTLGICDAGYVLQGFDSAGNKICVPGGPPASSIPDIDILVVKQARGPGQSPPSPMPAGFNLKNNQTYAECPFTHRLLACGGSREINAADNSNEENGGYVGTIPWDNKGCITGVDFNGGIEAVAIAYCMKVD